MAIRNALLGGRDWIDERGVYTDWNDTFNEIVRIVDNGN